MARFITDSLTYSNIDHHILTQYVQPAAASCLASPPPSAQRQQEGYVTFTVYVTYIGDTTFTPEARRFDCRHYVGGSSDPAAFSDRGR